MGTGKQVTEFLQQDPVRRVHRVLFSADGRLLAARGFTTEIFDVENQTRAGVLDDQLGGASDWASASFSPTGDRLVTCTGDEEALLWFLDRALAEDAPVLQSHSGAGIPKRVALSTVALRRMGFVGDTTLSLRHDQGIVHVAFSPDGRFVATASLDQTARVWNAVSGRPVTRPMMHPSAVDSVQFSADSKALFTACKIAGRLWEAETGDPLTPWLKHSRFLSHGRLSIDGTRIVTTGEDVRVWSVEADMRDSDDLIRVAQLLSGARVDSTGGLELLAADESEILWKLMRDKYPADFEPTTNGRERSPRAHLESPEAMLKSQSSSATEAP